MKPGPLDEFPSEDPLDEFPSEDSIGRSHEDHPSRQENPGETFAFEDPADIPALDTSRLQKPNLRGELSGRGTVGRRPYAALLAVTLTTAAGVWGVGAWQRRSAGLHSPAGSSTSTSTSRATAPVSPPQMPDAVAPPAIAKRGELSGSWVLTNRIEQSNVAAFHNLTLSFRLELNQDGNHLSGQGLKWEENGRRIHSRGRTPIAVRGTIEGNTVVLSFTERGTRRTSHGRLELQLTDDGVLDGRFSSGAAQSSGHARAVRISSP